MSVSYTHLATLRNRQKTTDLREQLPKHYFVAEEISRFPNKDDKNIVLVIDRQGKKADVVQMCIRDRTSTGLKVHTMPWPTTSCTKKATRT